MTLLTGETHPLVRAIYKSYELRNAKEKRREHLGASKIGAECGRALWYSFRWASPSEIEGRLLRLFETGHLEEPRLISDLRSVGATVLDRDPKTGKQWEYEDSKLGGHFRGSMDSAAKDVPSVDGWCLVEYKTSKAKGFKRLQSMGVKRAKPEHYAQMQVYMGWSGLKQALYIVKNKDTDNIHVELVTYDSHAFTQLSDRARQVVESDQPLSKVSKNTEMPPCSWCDHKEICQENKVAEVNCRTCAHATPKTDGKKGKWMCEKLGTFLDGEEQAQGCDEHLFIPSLVPYAKPVDSGDGFVLYQIGDGPKFYNVAAGGFPASEHAHMSSKQLRDLKIMDFDGIPVASEFPGKIAKADSKKILNRDGSPGWEYDDDEIPF